MNPSALQSRLIRALRPVDTPSQDSPWNLDEIHDLLPVEPLRPAAVLMGLRQTGHGMQVLLTRRTEALRQHAGQIAFPGGRIEDSDASPIAAALREAHEEVGLAPQITQPLGYLDAYATITGFHVYPVVAIIDEAFNAVIDPSEVAEAFEVPLDFLLDPVNEQRVTAEFRGIKRSIIEFNWQHYRIWGATAAMLVNFRQRWERAI